MLYDCDRFIALKPFKRSMKAKSLRVCFGCLTVNHMNAECAAAVCPHCTSGQKHHQLLCFKFCDMQREQAALVNLAISQPSAAESIGQPLRRRRTHFTYEPKEDPSAAVIPAHETSGSLLATALIRVRALNGDFKVVRALLDTGAQANLISDSKDQMLMRTKRKYTRNKLYAY